MTCQVIQDTIVKVIAAAFLLWSFKLLHSMSCMYVFLFLLLSKFNTATWLVFQNIALEDLHYMKKLSNSSSRITVYAELSI